MLNELNEDLDMQITLAWFRKFNLFSTLPKNYTNATYYVLKICNIHIRRL